jgi:hypothetical protein
MFIAASVSWRSRPVKEPKNSFTAAANSPSGSPPLLGAQVLPQERVEDVPGQVERQALLQLVDGGEISLVPRLAQLLQSRIRPRHIPGMVLVVMQRQQPGRVMRLESGVVVRKLRERVLHGSIPAAATISRTGA